MRENKRWLVYYWFIQNVFYVFSEFVFFSLKPSADPKMLRLIDAAVSEELGKKQTNTLTDTLDGYVY